jgi:hypothetical protein
MEPVSQHHIESEIVRLSALCEKATTEVAKRGQAAATADTAYDLSYAKAFLLAKRSAEQGQRVSDEMAKAEAKLACAIELGERNDTSAVLDAAKEAGRNYRAQLDALRSINANHRALVTG